MGQIVDIANAFVASLNTQTLSLTFTAVRRYGAFTDLEETPNPAVVVVPLNVSNLRPFEGSRRDNVRHYGLQLIIQKKLASEGEIIANDVFDPLVNFCEELWDFIEPDDDSEGLSPAGAQWVSTEHEGELLYETDDINERRLFTNITSYLYSSYS